MKTTIATNGLTNEALLRLFPMVYSVNSDGVSAEVEHDQPLVFPSDAAVVEALVQDQWDKVRERRLPLLMDADWRVARAEDQGLDVAAWRAYRQALRDVTKQPDPLNVVWPTKPQIGDDTAPPIG